MSVFEKTFKEIDERFAILSPISIQFIKRKIQEHISEAYARGYLDKERELNSKNTSASQVQTPTISDAEIEKQGHDYWMEETNGDRMEMYVRNNFITGAKWMRDRLSNATQNKNQSSQSFD